MLIADRSAFVVWIYSAMSIHPAVSGYSKLTDTQRNALSKTAAELLQRLMTEDCRAETIAALKYEGSSAIEGSFNTLGQVAMRDLISNPEVAKSFEKLGSYIDAAKFEALGKDAGMPAPAKPK